MFAYIAGSPFVLIQLHGIPAEHFGWVFGLNALGFVIASQVNARLLRTRSLTWLLHHAIWLPALAGLALALASLAGVLYVYYNRFVNPVASSFPISVEAALMAIVGGTATFVGPFLGAGVVLGLRNWVSSFVDMHRAIMGAVFVATVLWAPDGLVGLAGRVRARLAGRRDG